MEKKRFILFVMEQYYPSGGMNDAMESFDLEEYEVVKKEYPVGERSVHIFDTEKFKTYNVYSDGYPDLSDINNNYY